MESRYTDPADPRSCEKQPSGEKDALAHRPSLRWMPAQGKRDPVISLLCTVGGFLASALLVALTSWAEGKEVLNVVIPIGLAGACGWTAFRLFTSDLLNIWMPMPWLCCSSALFFGFGPLIYIWGDEAAIASMDEVYPVGSEELFQTNLLNIVGLFCIFAAFALTSRAFPSPLLGLSQPKSPDKDAITKIVTLLFLLFGLPLHFFLVLPYALGMLGFVLPGFVLSLDQINILALFLLGYLSGRSGRGWSALFYSLLVLHMAVDVVRFDKQQLVLIVLMAGLGVCFGTRRRAVLAATMVTAFLLYLFLVPVVLYGREVVKQSADDQASLGERILIAVEGIRLRATNELQGDSFGSMNWWARLAYSNAEAFAIHLHDSGKPGPFFDTLYYWFVPRLLFPDKPSMTEDGIDITDLAVGHRESSTGLCVFGDLYWNGAWPLVIGGSLYIGVVCAFLSRLAARMVLCSDWLLLPCSVIAVMSALRLDGWFAINYIGGILILLGYLVCVSFLRPWIYALATGNWSIGGPSHGA